MAKASGISYSASGAIASEIDSTLTLARPSACVIVSNVSGVPCYVRINGPASSTRYDFILPTYDWAIITDIWVKEVHVYVAATEGIRVVAW